MKLPSLLFTLSLATTAMATKPYPPYTNTDMNTIGRGFEGVEKYYVSELDGNLSRCSAVKINIPAPGAVYLTAAHCLSDEVKRIELKGRNAAAFFIHPAFPVARQFDLAAFLMMGESKEGGYEVFNGPAQDLLNATTIHVGYGTQEGVQWSERQGFVATINQISDSTFEQNLNTHQRIMAQVTSGDSGGPLFVRDHAGVFKVAGLGNSRMVDPFPDSSQWTILTSDFVQLVQITFAGLDSSYSLPWNLGLHAERYWLANQGHQFNDWAQLQETLSQLPESLYQKAATRNPRPTAPTSSFSEILYLVLLKKAADQGHAWAQIMMAVVCYLGEGVPQSNEEAFRYLHLSAKGGNADAQVSLGLSYIWGDLSEANAQLARYWIEAAQAQANPEALTVEIQDIFGQLFFCIPED